MTNFEDKFMKNQEINKKEIIDNVTPFIENLAKETDLTIVDVDMIQEAGIWHLRVFIYNKEHSITHEDCEKITRLIGDKLESFIKIPYYLEVSSPGLERKLKSPKEYNIFKNHKVDIKLKAPIEEGLKKFEAIILIHENNKLTLKLLETGNTIIVNDENISSIKLVADFSKDK